MDKVRCLQCGESREAIRASQRSKDPIFCGAVDYFGNVEWEFYRHRFRPWTDNELRNMLILPEYYDQHRRIMSLYEVPADHRDKRRLNV